MPRFDVTIAGELNLDLILYGLPPELPPERELLADRMALTLGSSSAIVAHNLACLGTRVGFQSVIGADALGQIALQRLAESGVDVSRVRQTDGPLGTGLTVILPREGWRNILTYAGTIAALTLDDLDLDYLADSRHFHFSSYYLQSGLRPQLPELLRRLKSKGLTISLDTNDDPADRWGDDVQDVLPLVDMFFPNRREACKIAGTEDINVALKKLGQMAPLVVVKLGTQGAIALRGNERIEVPSVRIKAVDPVGAGDSFNGGFLNAFLQGDDLGDCVAAGNLAGALATTRPGGTEAFRDREHREGFLRRHGQRH
jgi:sugar/nucleoside kinase (ribokinase family)